MKYLLIIFISLSFYQCAKSQNVKFDTFKMAFKEGEKLKYKAHHGFIQAADITVEVKAGICSEINETCFKLSGQIRIASAFNWILRKKDCSKSFNNKAVFTPWLCSHKSENGDFIFNENLCLAGNSEKNIASIGFINPKKSISNIVAVQDLVAELYRARTIDFDKAVANDTFRVVGLVGDKIIPITFKLLKRENIKTAKGVFRCIKFKTITTNDNWLSDEDRINFWLSDDKNHILIRLKVNLPIGSAYLDLSDYENICNPLAIMEQEM